MPGLMIVLALVLAPAMDSGLKDPWAAGRAADRRETPEPRDDQPTPGGERSADLRDPFESAPRSADLKDPFEHAPPGRERSTDPVRPHRERSVDPGARPHRERSTDLRDPFEDASPQARHPRAGDLRDPFDRPRRSPPPRSTDLSADLKDPFVDPGKPQPERGALIDPFRAKTGKRVDPSARTGSLELRNPFAPRPRRRGAR